MKSKKQLKKRKILGTIFIITLVLPIIIFTSSKIENNTMVQGEEFWYNATEILKEVTGEDYEANKYAGITEYLLTDSSNNETPLSKENKENTASVDGLVARIKYHFETAKRNVLYIETSTEMWALAKYVNEGNDCSGYTINLLGDIKIEDEEGTSWKPIGSGNYVFSGTFNGNGFTISGMKANYKITGSGTINMGLFGTVKGLVKNLVIKDASIKFSSDNIYGNADAGGLNIGLIAGKLVEGQIFNCKNVSDAICSTVNYNNTNVIETLGGIVGVVETGRISLCENTGTLVGDIVGGIVGSVNGGEIIECKNSGEIISSPWGKCFPYQDDDGENELATQRKGRAGGIAGKTKEMPGRTVGIGTMLL